MKDVAIAVVAAILFVWLTPCGIELAWNRLVPSLFHGPAMNYQQAGAAFLLIVLVAAIFKFVGMMALWGKAHG
jgi:hypothetical protein